jgi:hypothetical protein
MGMKWIVCVLLAIAAPAIAQVHGTGTIHDNDTAGAQTFAQRCAASGVLKCVSFDTSADFNQGSGGTQGAWGDPYGIVPPSGTSNYGLATLDTTTYKDGGGSLKFKISATAGSDVAGAWFTNFKDDRSGQVGEGQDIYVQWRERFTSGYLTTVYQQADSSPAGGWKIMDISAGDKPTCSLAGATSALCPTTCWDFETVIQNTNQHVLPQIYTNCAGPYPYFGLYGSTTNITVQNVVKCLYPDYDDPPCVKFHADEWMTFQVHIHVGTWNTWSSTLQMWSAREGGASVLIIDCSSTATDKCINGLNGDAANGWYLYNSDTSYKFGKIWLVPYHTSRSASFTYTDEYTWIDDLVLSTQPIADPQ